MVEESGQPAAGGSADTEGPQKQEQVVQPGSFVNPDGTFKEGWLEALVPEDFRHLGAFKTFTDIRTAMKQLGNLEKLRGKQGKGVIPPGEDATDTERELFWKAVGRPDKPDDYKIEVPKELEDYYDDDYVKGWRERFHKAGLTQAQVSAVLAGYDEMVAEGQKINEKAQRAADEEYEKAIHAKWGDAWEQRLHVANRMIAENVASEEDRKTLLGFIDNNVVVADFLATIGAKFMESSVVHTEDKTDKLTPGEAKLKMNELIAEQVADAKMQWNNPAKFQRLNQEIKRYAEMSLAGQE